MIGVLVVTHGDLARELVEAAKIILDEDPGFRYLTLSWDKSLKKMKNAVREAVADADNGEGVVVLTDMFGGTPTNLVMPLLEENKVEVITGVNLPMLIKLAHLRNGKDLSRVVDTVTRKGIESIQQASKYLRKKD